MIDHLVGRPNPSWKRAQVSLESLFFIMICMYFCLQVFLVIIFWLWRIVGGKAGPPKILWLTKINRALREISYVYALDRHS